MRDITPRGTARPARARGSSEWPGGLGAPVHSRRCPCREEDHRRGQGEQKGGAGGGRSRESCPDAHRLSGSERGTPTFVPALCEPTRCPADSPSGSYLFLLHLRPRERQLPILRVHPCLPRLALCSRTEGQRSQQQQAGPSPLPAGDTPGHSGAPVSMS